MESSCSSNHLFLNKVSRLFPSAFTCHFRTVVPDVVVPLPHPTTTSKGPPSSSSSSSSSSFNSFIPNNNNNRNKLCSETSPLFIPHSSHPSNLIKKRGKPHTVPSTTYRTNNSLNKHRLSSSSSHTTSWFTSTTTTDDLESDTFFSLSSYSGRAGDSFRLKSAGCSRRFSQDQMKRIDERGGSSSSSRSFSSLNSCRKTASAGSTPAGDQISAQLYYGGGPDRHRSSSRPPRTAKRTRRKTKRSKSSSENGRMSLEWKNKAAMMMEESYAVEKKSRDPRGDFRASMVEMIVEKQMFAEGDLERLLQCFLSLNSETYHGIIVQVFTEICETLFSN